MKITHLFAAAGLAIASLGATTAANAQDYGRDHYGRGYDHRGDRDYRDDHGRRHGWGRDRERCRTEWRHHHRVTRCYR